MGLIDIDRVSDITGYSKVTINTYRSRADKNMPKPKVIEKVGSNGGKKPYWDEKEIRDWCIIIKASRRNAAILNIDTISNMLHRGRSVKHIAKYYNTTCKRIEDFCKRYKIEVDQSQLFKPLYGMDVLKPDFKSPIYEHVMKNMRIKK